MSYIATYLIYITVTIRAITWYVDRPPLDGFVLALLAAYGLVLVTEPLLSRRFRLYSRIYLVIQAALTITLLFTEGGMDFLAALFMPLSFQAVHFFGRKAGFAWIGAFSLALASPIMSEWGETTIAGLDTVLLFSFINFLVGNYAHLTRQAEDARGENQRMLQELQEAYRQLQDYATQAEEFAAAQERHRLAREMHDSVTQTVFSMNLTVQAARLLLGKDLQQVAAQLDHLQELARSAVGEIQVLISQLRPRSVAEEGLTGALRRLAAERKNRDGLQVSLEISGERELPVPLATGLYRIAQEALNNVSKHSGTGEATVRLCLEGSPAYLEVEDHGRGFESGKVARSTEHIGLWGMAERARELGWRLEVDSEPGRGTCLRVEENPA